MIRYGVSRLQTGKVTRALRRTRKRTRILTAQTLNRHARKVRTQLTRAIRADTGLTSRRVRRRILLPRSGRATPSRPVATTLTLLELTPMRWYAPHGPRKGKIERVPNRSGRSQRVVNLAEIAYPLRRRIVRQLSPALIAELNRRMRVEFRRIWGPASIGKRTARAVGQHVTRAADLVAVPTVSPRALLRRARVL